MFWTNDPVRDAERYASECEERDKKFIHCSVCGTVILYGDEYFEIDGQNYCPDCLSEQFGRTADYDEL